MKRKTIILTVLLLLSLVCMFRYCHSFLKDDIYPSNDKTVVLNLENGNNRIYIRSRSWGISANHQEIVFSEKPIAITDTITDYVFDCYDVYYKIKDAEKIIIYAPENRINMPKIPFSNIKVIIKGLKNYDEIQAMKRNYTKYGLSRISAH